MIIGISAQLKGKDLLKHEEIIPGFKDFKNVNLNLGVQGLKYVLHNLESFNHLRKKHGIQYSLTINIPIDLDVDMIFDEVETLRKNLKTNNTSINLLKSGVVTDKEGKQVVHRYELYSFKNVLNKASALSNKGWHLALPQDHYRANDFSITELKSACDKHKIKLFTDSSNLSGWRESKDKVIEVSLPRSTLVFANKADVKKNKDFFEHVVKNKQRYLIVLNSSDYDELEKFRDELFGF